MKNSNEYLKSVYSRFNPNSKFGNEKLVDIWIEFNIPNEIFNVLKSIRIFKNNEWVLSTMQKELLIERLVVKQQ